MLNSKPESKRYDLREQMINFDGIKYFKPDSTDSWGDPSRMDTGLLRKLDKLRELAKAPIRVNRGFDANGSTADSQHKYGRAVDIFCPSISLLDFYLLAEKAGFSGIGVYPHWHYQGTTCGGLHVDVRPGENARWMGVRDAADMQTYIALNAKNLKSYGVLK
jgi:uncharacterized protein YcbK (DUF882 family)